MQDTEFTIEEASCGCRDDAETSFLVEYLRLGVLEYDPFTSLDVDGAGVLIDMAVTAGTGTRPDPGDRDLRRARW